MENNEVITIIQDISLSKSGSYIKSILNKHPELVKYLNTFLEKYSFLKTYQDVLYFIKNDYYMPYCKTCGKELPYLNIRRGRKYCSCKCRSNDPEVKEKTINTCIKKFGVDNPAKSQVIINKTKQTNLKKYNTECPLQNPEIKEKTIKTLLRKFNVDNSFKNKDVREKQQQTMLKKYNVRFTAQSPKLLEKMLITNNKKYGGNAPMCLEETKNKYKLKCLQKYGFDNSKKAQTWNSILSWKDYVIPLFNKDEYVDKNTIYLWKCVKCGNEFKQQIHTTHFNEEHASLPRCLKCYPKSHGFSKSEKELVEFCKEYFPNLIENNKKLIKPYELDIVINELHLAIEFNGIYWHSLNSGCEQSYHLMKTELCESKNYRLIHIWEDEWNNNKEEIKNKLINVFTNKEIINYNNILDRCWYQYKEIPGYSLEILPPEIINKNNFQIENCGYLKYTKLS